MISILITSAYEPGTIGKAIEALRTKAIKGKCEVIVAAPDKETRAAAKQKGVQVLADKGKGKPAALNQLFAKARGDIFVLTDGDVQVGKNAVKNLTAAFADPRVGAVSGRPVAANQRSTMLGYWAHLLADVGADETRKMLVREGKFIACSGYLMAVRKGIVKRIPENVLSDDAVISNLVAARGYRIAYAPDARVLVQYPTTWSDWLKQKRRSAAGYVQMRQVVQRKDEMRSFVKESAEIMRALRYPKTVKEGVWTIALVFARLYLWLVVFYDMKIKRKGLKELWLRVESTKHGLDRSG